MSSSSYFGNPNSLLQQDYIIPNDEQQKNIVLRQYLNNISSVVNTKDSGLYDSVEVLTGQNFYPTFSTTTGANINYRQVYRKVIDTGILPNATTKTIAHGITTVGNSLTEVFTLTKLYGAATDPSVASINSAIPLPYVSLTLNNQISLSMDATNIIITTAIDYTSYTRSYVIVEYLKVL